MTRSISTGLLAGLLLSSLACSKEAAKPGGGTGGNGGDGGSGQGGTGGTGGKAGSGGNAGSGGQGGNAGQGGGAGQGGSAGSGGAAGTTGGSGGPGTGGTVVDAAVGGADTGSGGTGAGSRTVAIILIDGLQPDAARTAAANGANTLKMVIDQGVTVTKAHSTSPAARTTWTGGGLPWGNATSGNIAVHTGTHVYELGKDGMDDIFKAAAVGGIKSVFSGGDANYMAFTTATFHYAAGVSDEMVVRQAITHVKNDKVRLLRLHLQRIRDDWSGPAGKTDPMSAYVRHIVASDAFLGQLIQAFKDEGVWNDTYLIVTADHGMGQTNQSGHTASTASSWDIFMGFYGPGLKKGATIPYAELPDVAVTAMRFLNLPPLKGHTGAVMNLAQKGPTGTLLTNVFAGAPDEIPHPRYVEQYLKMNTFPGTADMYPAYRTAMLGIIK